MSSDSADLVDLLTPEQVEAVLRAPTTSKQQPLAWLVRDREPDYTGQERANTCRAARRIRDADRPDLANWLRRVMVESCGTRSYDNAASRLAEVRALGYLIEARAAVVPIPTALKPTADFRVSSGGEEVLIEVASTQMNGAEADALAGFYRGEGRRFTTPDGVTIGEHVYHPAGRPRLNGTVAERVAGKFAATKELATQAASDKPSVVWVDLQNEDWCGVDQLSLEPVKSSHHGEFVTVGLWHGFYGLVGTPLLEGNAVEERAVDRLEVMPFPGLFAKQPLWSGAVLSLPHATVVFENPCARNPLPTWFHGICVRLPWFDYGRSWMSWPMGTRSLALRLLDARRMLVCVARIARYRW